MGKMLLNLITGFFENLWYTFISIMFLFFIKKWFFKFINKHLYGGNYHLTSKVYNRYNPFRKCVICMVNKKCDDKDYHIVDGNVDIVKFDGDLRLRIKNKKGEIKIVVIGKHLIPIKTYIHVFWRIFKNVMLQKFENKSEPIYAIKTSNELEKVLDDEFAILEFN